MSGRGIIRYSNTASRGGSRGASRSGSRGGSVGSRYSNGDSSQYHGPGEQPSSPEGSASRPIARPIGSSGSAHQDVHEDPVPQHVNGQHDNAVLDSDSDSDSDEGEAPLPMEPGRPYFSHTGAPGAILIRLDHGVLDPTGKIARINKQKNFYRLIQLGGFKWRLLSQETINNYWEEFKKYVSWVNISSVVVQAVWARQAKDGYKSHVSKILKPHWLAKERGMPRGIDKDEWNSFITYWKDDKTIEEAARNAKIRSESPAITYYGGSKSCKRHREDLVAKGLPDCPYVVYNYTYTKGHDGKTYPSAKGRRVDVNYHQLKEQQSAPASIQFTEIELYQKAVEKEGGTGHGRIYGQGKAAGRYYGEFGGGSTSSGQMHGDEIDLRQGYNQIIQEMAELKAQNARIREESLQSEMQFTQTLAGMFAMFAGSGQGGNFSQQPQTFTSMLSGMPQAGTSHPGFMPVRNPFSSQMPYIPQTGFQMPHVPQNGTSDPQPSTRQEAQPREDLQAPDWDDGLA